MDMQRGPARSRRWNIKQRLNADFQFAMLVAFGLLTSFAIAGFAIYRFLSGNLWGGVFNLLVMLLILSVMAHAVRTDDTRQAGILFVTVITLGALGSSLMFGVTGLSWSYLVLWINFVLTERRVALAMNLLLLGLTGINPGLFDGLTALTTYLITGALITTFAYIFAKRSSYQQEQLEVLATQDPLTLTGNRRSMRQDLIAAVEDHRRSGRPYTLMLLDLDFFKHLNDRHGHDAGDQALRDFAALLRANVRAGDRVYRFGGEEFVVLFPDTGAEAAERLTRSVHEKASGTLPTPEGPICFSAGVAALEAEQTPDTWLTAADRALYQAKSDGRGRVKFSQPATVEAPPESAASVAR
ncbi:MAG: GGDEF domain-containing protein [Wenzhouxiangella sp.]